MKINFLKRKFFLIFIFCHSLLLANNEYTIVGFVKNINSNESIAGARILIQGTNTGTYSSSRGFFKLPFVKGTVKLKVSSIGYKSKTLELNPTNDTVIVKLEPIPVKLKEATVIGEIEANEVIRRAIAKRIENKNATKTLKALLYSKLVMELDGSVFGGANGNSFTIAGSIGDTAPAKYKMFLMETFSRIYKDFEKNYSYSEIIQRRQTSNITPESNLLSIGNILDFSKDEVRIINTYFISPISDDAFDYYHFEIVDKEVLDDKYIYVIKVSPTTDVYPLFDGVIKISEGDYQLIEIDLKPSKTTKIALVDDLHFIQKFEKGVEGLWSPRMFEVTGKAKVDVIKSLMDVKVDLKATSIYSDVTLNEKLPDSIYTDNPMRISVAQQADSIDNDYWEKNSMREISEKEQQMYAKVDSLVKLDSSDTEVSDFRYGLFSPYLDFNRVSSVTLGLAPNLSYKNLRLDITTAYSFGVKKILGNSKLTYSNNGFIMSAYLGYDVGEMGTSSIFPRILNTAFAALFHYDYYDYYYKENYGLSLSYSYSGIRIFTEFNSSNDYSLNKSTNQSIFSKDKWRDNLEIEEGHYNLINASVKFEFDRLLKLGNNYNLDLDAYYSFGKNTETNKDFNNYKASLEFAFPTFFTGYSPMKFESKITYAKLNDVPIQHSERLNRTLLFIKLFGSFGTLPLSMYERDELIIINARYNLTDLWWRWIGLPLYEGRGLDLIINGSTGNFKSIYSKNWYSEIGFSLERFPTFVSNVFYFGVGFDWGIGNIARNKFGAYLNFTLPF